MRGQLTTHVLDTAQGRPAAGMAIELWRLGSENGGRALVKSTKTNADGRTGAPLLASGALEVGTYELVFMVGNYFAKQGIPTPEPPFLDQVPIRFGISDPNAHYHIPLLTSPWSYSTYRGS